MCPYNKGQIALGGHPILLVYNHSRTSSSQEVRTPISLHENISNCNPPLPAHEIFNIKDHHMMEVIRIHFLVMR